jgi:hypothetical protein
VGAVTDPQTADPWDGDGHHLDFGNGVTARWLVHGDDPTRVSLIETHTNNATGKTCYGSVMFDLPYVRRAFPGSHVWAVESWEPLTVSPSVLCRECGHHGFIREGRWVPA